MTKRPLNKTAIATALLLLSGGVGLWLGQNHPSNQASTAPEVPRATRYSETTPPTSPQSETDFALPQDPPPPETSSLAIPNERVLTFPNATDYRNFLANNKAFEILGANESLRAIRISYRDKSSLLALPSTAQTDFNYTVLTPIPVVTDTLAQDKAFGGTALEFMRGLPNNQHTGAGVKVAILDTGIRDHTTIDSSKLERYGESPPSEYLSHGTAVASLIAGQNGIGIAPQADLISIQVLDSDGIGDAFTLAQGIIKAVDAGANVINMSLGSYGSNTALTNAVDYASAHGVVLVASAGNEAVSELPYPAAYQSVIAVAAIDADGHPTSFSNQNTEIDIAAPGVGVYAAWEDEKWISFTGTSAAAPYVSGAIAALSSELNIPATEAATLLIANANDSGLPGKDPQLGAGYVDLQRSYDSTTKYTDLALSDIYLSPESDENGQYTLYLTAQNRGTQNIPTANLSYTLPNGITQSVYLGSLEPGQDASHSLKASASELENGFEITASVNSNKQSPDDRSDNDTKSTLVLIPIQAPAP